MSPRFPRLLVVWLLLALLDSAAGGGNGNSGSSSSSSSSGSCSSSSVVLVSPVDGSATGCCTDSGICQDSSCVVFGFPNSAKSNCNPQQCPQYACGWQNPSCQGTANHCYGYVTCPYPSLGDCSEVGNLCLQDGNSTNFKICDSGAGCKKNSDCAYLGTGATCTTGNAKYCQVPALDCVWGAWGAWQSCSASCLGGIQYRYRAKTVLEQGGGVCTGDYQQNTTCNTGACGTSGTISTAGTCTAPIQPTNGQVAYDICCNATFLQTVATTYGCTLIDSSCNTWSCTTSIPSDVATRLANCQGP